MRIREIIEESPIRRFHYRILAVCFLGWMFDAMNSGLISFVLSPLSQELSLPPGKSGFLLSSWLVGMFFGGFLMGTIADRLGRRNSILSSIILYSIPAASTGLADNWMMIAALRFLSGIGASGFMAVTSTLISEYFPRKNRGRFVAFLESAWAFGWLLAAYLGLVIAPSLGWRPVMLTGFAPLLAAALFYLFVPESIRFLERKGLKEKALRVLDEASFLESVDGEVEVEKVKERKRFTITGLWSSEYRSRTLMIWIHWFCIVLTYWGIFLWAPYILAVERGLSLVRSLQYSFLIVAMQIPGYWSGSLLIERVGRKWLLASYMALAGLGSLMFANATTPLEVLLWGSVISFFNLGAWGITYAYTPELYPTSLRASGAGWANSVGRVGGIIGPIIAGLLLQAIGSRYPIFIIFALIHFVSTIVLSILGIETKGKQLE